MKVKLMYYFSLPLFIPLFRTESSSTWRASTTRRWSTTLFWLTADTHTLTRTHSITATLGDAERGTAYRLASADRNHSCPPPHHHFSFLSSLAARAWLFIRPRRRMDGQTEDQRPAVFTLGLPPHRATALSSASSSYLSLPFHFCMTFVHSLVVSVLCYCQYFDFPLLGFRSVSVLFHFCRTWWWCHCHVHLTSSWPLQPSCLWFSVTLLFFFFLQFIYLRTNGFTFCAILLFFSFWN